MFKTFVNAWKLPELRKKIYWTVLLLAIFRLGSFITAPGVDAVMLRQMSGGDNLLLSTISMITGGAFNTLSIFALSISPYITASIIIQLLAFAIPALERISKDGETGKKKMSAYTRYAAVVLAAIEAFAIYLTYSNQSASMGINVFLSNGIILYSLSSLSTIVIGRSGSIS